MKVAKTTIARDLWLAALGESDAALDPDALTVQEFGALLEISNGPARTRLERLVREGKAVKVRKRITLSDGRTQPVGAYRLKDAA